MRLTQRILLFFLVCALTKSASSTQSASSQKLASQVDSILANCQASDDAGYSRCAIEVAKQLSPSLLPLWRNAGSSDNSSEKKLVKELLKTSYDKQPFDFEQWMKTHNTFDGTNYLFDYAVYFRTLEKLQEGFKQRNFDSCVLTTIPHVDAQCEKFCQLVPSYIDAKGYGCRTKEEWKRFTTQLTAQNISLTHEDEDSESIFASCAQKWPSNLENAYVPNWSTIQTLLGKSGEFSDAEKDELLSLFKLAIKKPSRGKISPVAAIYRIIKLLQLKADYEQTLGMPLVLSQMPAQCSSYAPIFTLAPFFDETLQVQRRSYLYSNNHISDLYDGAQKLKNLINTENLSLTPNELNKRAISNILSLYSVLYGSYHSTKPLIKGLAAAFTETSGQQPYGWLMAKHLLSAPTISERRAIVAKGYQELSLQYEQTMGLVCQPGQDSLYRLEYMAGDQELQDLVQQVFPALSPVQECLKSTFKERAQHPKKAISAVRLASSLLSMFIKGSSLYGDAVQFVSARMSDDARQQCFSAVGSHQCQTALATALSDEGSSDELFEIFTSRVSGSGSSFRGGRPPKRDDRIDAMMDAIESDLRIASFGSYLPNRFQAAQTINHISGSTAALGTVTRFKLKEITPAIQTWLANILNIRIRVRGSTRVVHVELPDNAPGQDVRTMSELIYQQLLSMNRPTIQPRGIINTVGASRANLIHSIELLIQTEIEHTQRTSRLSPIALGQNRFSPFREQVYRAMDTTSPSILIVGDPQNHGAEVMTRLMDIGRDRALSTILIVVSAPKVR